MATKVVSQVPPMPPGQTDQTAWTQAWQNKWIYNPNLPLTVFGFPDKIVLTPPCDPTQTVTFSRRMVACPLTINGPAGSEPNSKSVWWTKYFNTTATGYKKRAWVQGHLLNHNIHGPGVDENLVPITDALNRIMEKWAEKVVKDYVAKGKILYYEVTVHWNCGAQVGTGQDWLGNAKKHPAEMHKAYGDEMVLGECLAPTHLEWAAHEIQWDTNQWKVVAQVPFKGYEEFEDHQYPNSFNQIPGSGVLLTTATPQGSTTSGGPQPMDTGQ